MVEFLSYLLAPNPRGVGYGSMSMATLLLLCALLVAGSFAVRYWRGRQENAVLRKLSRSWSSTMFWFGIVGVVLIVSRVEGIQFLAMRFLWIVWTGLLLGIAFLQYRLFRARFYAVIPSKPQFDPRDRYIPGKKRR